MQVKFTVGDRIILPEVLPAKGSYEDMTIKGDILDKIRFKQEEYQKYGITQVGAQIAWKDVKTTFDYEFTELEEAQITRSLTELSNKKELKTDQVGLYKKFVAKVSDKTKAEKEKK